MRILLLNLYYPPDTSATAKMGATVAEALSTRHDVTVLCGRPSYDPSERRPWRLWQTELAERVRITRVGSTDYPRSQMKRRVLNYLTYVALAIPRSLFLQCDVVLAMTDPPFEGIVGAIVAMLKGKPYVYNIRDMYPDMAVGGAIVEPGVLARVWERMHRWALRRASRVIVLGEDMRARIIAKGVEPAGIEIVRDGADIPPIDAPPPALDEDIIRAIRADFRFVFLHAGNLGFYGAWETVDVPAVSTPARLLASERRTHPSSLIVKQLHPKTDLPCAWVIPYSQFFLCWPRVRWPSLARPREYPQSRGNRNYWSTARRACSRWR